MEAISRLYIRYNLKEKIDRRSRHHPWTHRQDTGISKWNWMIREIVKMLNQYAVDNPTLPVNQCHSHIIHFLSECQAVLWECRTATMGHQVFGTRMVFRETFFANPTASSSAPYTQRSHPRISNVSEHTSPHVMSERQTPNTPLDPRCQSGPSARNSFVPREGGFSNNYGADQQRLQISDLHFDKSPHQQRSLVGR